MTSISLPHRSVTLRSSRPARQPGPGVGLRRSIALMLVPGTASEDVVPAVHAADAQALLVQAGVLDGAAATGRWNGATVAAVSAFQRTHGLAATGVADQRTADALLHVAA